MTDLSVSISFGNHKVTVYVEDTEVLSILKQWFQAILTIHCQTIVRELWIIKHLDKYLLKDESAIIKTQSDLLSVLVTAKYEIITSLIKARPDLLWFHAGAVADTNGAIILPGIGGSGKSTLVVELLKQGWNYLSDDAIALDLETDYLYPFPQTPRVRKNLNQPLSVSEVAKLPKSAIEIPSNQLVRDPTPIKQVIFPRYTFASQTILTSYSPGNIVMELLRNCINFTDHQQKAMNKLCEIFSIKPGWRIQFSDYQDAVKVIRNLDAAI